MKAVVLTAADQPLVLEEVNTPELNANEVLIKIKAAALNRRDYRITIGKYAGIKYPTILGSDGAGIVTEVGVEVNKDLLGKEVIINPGYDWGSNPSFQGKDFKILGLPDDGTFAEYVKVNAECVFPKPSHLTFEQAAALPLAGLTAYRALFTKGNAKNADKVLISGVGSGTGTFALQFAVATGCEVYVTTGNEIKLAKALALGANGGVNYKDPQWSEILLNLSGGFDVIIDSALGDGFVNFIDLANPGARIVFFGGTAGNIPELNGRKIFWKQLQILGTTMGTTEEFGKMLAFVNQHKIIPVIDCILPLANANEAIKKMDNSTQFGKIVLVDE